MTASVLLSQGSQDFRNRYGEPDRERFAARPGITLTVEYGSDHLACYALIDPPQPLLYSDEHVPLMSSEGVTEVLEEVAPVAMRGKEIFSASSRSTHNQVAARKTPEAVSEIAIMSGTFGMVFWSAGSIHPRGA